METPKATDVKKGISLLWETLQCPICLELLTAPVSTKCDHQFCKFCMTKLLDNSKQNRASCPVCKAKITRRSLQESPGFQRLVAGLQDMIKAYEHDTGTNYFTGLSWPFKDSDTQAETAHDGSSGDTCDADLDHEKHSDHNNLSQSQSSTIAAQNGFAKLMGFEELPPSLTENEGLDSGLGDAPPTSDKKISSPADDVEPVQFDASQDVEEAASTHKGGFDESLSLSPVPDENEPNSWRKKQKKKSKILKQKKKKSLEKVAEWLMTVPTDGTLELEELEKNGDDSDSCSSSSTIDIKQHINDMTLKRENQTKALEERVFGVTYTRRSSRIVPAPPNSVAEPSLTRETQADERKENCPDDTTNGWHEVGEATNDTGSDFFKEAGQMEVREGNDTCVEELNEPGGEGNKDEPDSESGPKTRKRTRSALQQVDSDLKGQEQKKPDRRKGRITTSGRVQKPLVLVGVQEGESSPQPRARPEEAQLQIESYPSSEDQDVSLLRSTRRSRRLEVFAEQVQGGQRKASPTEKTSGRDGVTKQSDAAQVQDVKKPGAAKRNGCVYHQDITEIENISKSVKDHQGSVEMGSNPERPEVSPAPSVSVVPESTSLNNADVVEPTDHSLRETQLETSAADDEEEQNDCEVNTEQLMKSFKATKRKSFHLGCADAKKRRPPDQDEEKHQVSSGDSEANREALRDTEKSTGSDLISPSISPIQMKKTVSGNLDEVTVEGLIPDGSCSGQESLSSGALPPNQVPRSNVESLHVSFVPQVIDSGLRFTAVEHEDVDQTSRFSHVTESQLSCEVKDGGKGKRRKDSSAEQLSADTNEHGLFPESSLTPDGLMPPDAQNVQEASGEVSSHSSVPISRRKRRAQTLESSGSDTSGSNEDLPSLAQIFGTSACPPADHQDPGEGNAGEGAAEPLNRPSPCPSPDCISPSQGSVDLFGTPDESDAPAHNVEVSMESSQFSSEVLVTQQKLEMQKELVRLEKLMALVSEVLQEKEGSPPKDAPPDTRQCSRASDAEPPKPPQCSQDGGHGSGRKNVPDAEGDSHPGPSGVKRAEPAPPKPDGVTEMVQHTGSSVKTSKTLTSTAKPQKSGASSSDEQENKENNSPPKDDCRSKLVLVSSGLGSSEQMMVKKFARTVGARLVPRVTPEVTHVVMGTDEQLVCERTLKYFLGIAGRKWVVSLHWISECFKQRKLLDEGPFEVRGDAVNGANHRGPSRARATPDSNLLMKGFRICFQGSFTDMTTDELEWMVELCGADVVKDPLLLDGKQKSHQLVIVQHRLDASSRSYLSRHATVVTRSWLLDSVSTYSLQNPSSYSA
ncbi:breast cancer type 1 susceptibility protein homolog isoform X2 [Salarias fasciatus]|uniref:breast cancer type 1 susceptibility protein homolog isoform X2 n=1 Tax=Salarias fasciatus TaxID=181472 RepID=UPI0011766886|nr:breast cancer type 1 susceptibility protein isoform X2 [Salarias fasciatus]